MAFDIYEFFARYPGIWKPEDKARLVSEDREALRWCLNDCRTCLISSTKRLFRNAKFDFEHKRLIGDGVALQWKLRRWPDKPVSYENQQTNTGDIEVVWLDEEGNPYVDT